MYSVDFTTMDPGMTLLMPLPVPPGVATDTVQFLNSDRRQRFFKNLARGFAAPVRQDRLLGRCASWLREYRTSRYHTPSPGEFRFVGSLEQLILWLQRCGRPVPAGLPLDRYGDCGFVVGQLVTRPGRRDGARAQTLAPLALSFPVQAAGSLFFPAVHFYAQEPLAPSAVEHVLYCQPGTDFDFTSGWQRSARASAWFRGGRTDAANGPIVDPESPCYRNVVTPAPGRP